MIHEIKKLNKIEMYDKDRYFDATFHLLAYEESKSGNKTDPDRLIFASYLGIPVAAKAITAGVIESRTVSVRGSGKFFRRGSEKFRKVERAIGSGDVLHSMVFSSYCTIEGLETAEEENPSSYIIAYDGDVDTAISEHVMARFGLPEIWKEKYGRLLNEEGYVSSVKILRNPELADIWPDARVVRLDVKEGEMLEIITNMLRSGEITIPKGNIQGVFSPGWSLKEYMLQNAGNMAKKLAEKQPRHAPDRPLDPAIAKMKRIPFPAQAHVIQSLANGLKYEDSVICSGDMGTGKSLISCGVINLLHEERKKHGHKGTAVLLSAPGITLPKWKAKELEGTLYGAKVSIIRNSGDALKLLDKIRHGYKPKGIEIYLVGMDKAKMDAEPYFGGVWKRMTGTHHEYTWHCPDCGRPLMKHNPDGDKDDYIPLEWNDIAEGESPTIRQIEEAKLNHTLLPNGLPSGFKVRWKRSKRFDRCTYHKKGYLPEMKEEVAERKLFRSGQSQECHAKLWRYALRERGETRINKRTNISRVLKKTKKWFDLFIQDEVHKCAADASGRGHAFAQMVKAAKKNLLLTGTLVNGKSTSIKEILWRTDPKALLDMGFDHQTGMVQWAERYGKLKQVVETKEQDTGWVTKQKKVAKQPTEEPGIAPQLVAQYLLHKAVFLELSDMGLPLVEVNYPPPT
ncbi:hypothetical protein, partial [Aneurinibacillus thermoaerophilus]|uniref:hypothetical protein n=1 Tax=Aneurinibacillus thermoaerophilus TaxID=143495 RepID=UPI002E20C31B|nr:hypothetical protein [Aneurinibacillus thermoaerophilus]